MTNWLYGETDREAVCDLFKAHRDDEIQIQIDSGVKHGWVDWSDSECQIVFSNDYRYRLKPRPLAKHWKKLEPDTELPECFALTSQEPEKLIIRNEYNARYWLASGWTRYADVEDILYGVGDE